MPLNVVDMATNKEADESLAKLRRGVEPPCQGEACARRREYY
jgi:hypothetical protein